MASMAARVALGCTCCHKLDITQVRREQEPSPATVQTLFVVRLRCTGPTAVRRGPPVCAQVKSPSRPNVVPSLTLTAKWMISPSAPCGVGKVRRRAK